jgi:hypothetical protein
VEEDYFAAIQWVEQRLELAPAEEETAEVVGEVARGQLLVLAERLVEPEQSLETRLDIAARIRSLLNGKEAAKDELWGEWIPPPFSPALAEAELV